MYLIPGSGGSPGGGNGNPLQYSCLGNPMDRGDWRATVHGVTESDMTERLSMQKSQTKQSKSVLCPDIRSVFVLTPFFKPTETWSL